MLDIFFMVYKERSDGVLLIDFTYVLFGDFLRSFLRLVLAAAFAVEAMREITECFLLVHVATVVIHVLELDLGSVVFLFLEIGNGSRLKAITSSMFIVDFTRMKIAVHINRTNERTREDVLRILLLDRVVLRRNIADETSILT